MMNIRNIVAEIDKAGEVKSSNGRDYLGCSELGHPCRRWLWLSFRNAIAQEHSGRTMRIFRRGKLEEETIIDDLESIGVKVRTQQVEVIFGVHIKGHLDAIISNVDLDDPEREFVAEFKTHNKSSFAELKKKGVKGAHFTHYVQMQMYMMGTGIHQAIYFAVCKDDDSIHYEAIEYDEAIAQKYLERAQEIVVEKRMPEPLSTDPSWYQCKMCPAHKFCHVTHTIEEKHCMTCDYCIPFEDGTWGCNNDDSIYLGIITDSIRISGCWFHEMHGDLVPFESGKKEIGNLTAAENER